MRHVRLTSQAHMPLLVMKPPARPPFWGYLLTRYAISALICTAAASAGTGPDRVKFTRAVRIIRRRVAGPSFSP